MDFKTHTIQIVFDNTSVEGDVHIIELDHSNAYFQHFKEFSVEKKQLLKTIRLKTNINLKSVQLMCKHIKDDLNIITSIDSTQTLMDMLLMSLYLKLDELSLKLYIKLENECPQSSVKVTKPN